MSLERSTARRPQGETIDGGRRKAAAKAWIEESQELDDSRLRG
jgi:hypothetical protein